MYLSFRRDESFLVPVCPFKVFTSGIRRYRPCCEPGGHFPKFSKAHGEEPPWENCCVIHDMAYHSAGASAAPEQSFANRAIADQALRACVVETGKKRLSEIAELYGADEDTVGNAYRAIANAMYLAVRLGGAPCSGMPWRWGYGYPHCFVTPSDLVGR